MVDENKKDEFDIITFILRLSYYGAVLKHVLKSFGINI